MYRISLHKEVFLSLVILSFLSVLTVRLSKEIKKPRDIRSKAMSSSLSARPPGQKLLIVTLEYQIQNKTASVKTVKIGQGVLQENNVYDLSHALIVSLTDQNNQMIYKTAINTNDEIRPEPPIPPYPQLNENPPIKQPDQTIISLKVPYIMRAKLTLSLPSGEQLIELQVPQINETFSIKEKYTLDTIKAVPLDAPSELVPLETIYDGNPNETDPSKMIDFVILPSNYTQTPVQGKSSFADFRTETQDAIDYLIGINGRPGKDPFTKDENKRMLRIKRVMTEEIFHSMDPAFWSGVKVDWNKIYEYLSQQQIHFDKFMIFIPVFGRSYASFGDYFVLFSKNPYSQDPYDIPRTFVHELGHSFGLLEDEYHEEDGTKIYQANPFNNARELNCKTGVNSPWINNINAPNLISCYGNLLRYRSSKLSIMGGTNFRSDLTFLDYQYNDVSKSLIQKRFDRFKSNSFLEIYPQSYMHFQILNANSAGNFIYLNNMGKRNISWTASAPEGSWVKLIDTAGTTPTSLHYEIITKDLPLGDHQTFITIVDVSTQESFVIPIKVRVYQFLSQVAIPTVSLSGDIVNGPVTLETSFNGDTRNIGWVDYYMQARNGHKYPIGQALTPPYSFKWNFISDQRRFFIFLIDSIIAVANSYDGRQVISAPLKVHQLNYYQGYWNIDCHHRDVNKDGIVDERDKNLVQQHLGEIEGKSENFNSIYDVDDDGTILQHDIDEIINNYSQACTPLNVIRTTAGWNKILDRGEFQGDLVEGQWLFCKKFSSLVNSSWSSGLSDFFSGSPAYWPGTTNKYYLNCSF